MAVVPGFKALRPGTDDASSEHVFLLLGAMRACGPGSVQGGPPALTGVGLARTICGPLAERPHRKMVM